MARWTLRQQRTRVLLEGEEQTHTAATRAQRYVWSHVEQSHGAGVEDAVRRLTADDLVRAGRESRAGAELQEAITRAFKGFAETAARARAGFELSGPVEETAHGLTVVGWKDPVMTGTYYCLAHRCMGGVPVTAADVTVSTECQDCGTRLLG